MADNKPGDPLAENYVQEAGLQDGSEKQRVHEQGAGFTKRTEAAEYGPEYDTGK